MKKIMKYLFLAAIAATFCSCEIDDEVLERSDSTIYHKLEADRKSTPANGADFTDENTRVESDTTE